MARGKLRGTGRADNLGQIKNKHKRQDAFKGLKKRANQDHKLAKKLKPKEAPSIGEAEPSTAPQQRTLDNTREEDDTLVTPGDDEVAAEDATDEFAAHFRGETPPRTLVTTAPRPSEPLLAFLQEFVAMVPQCEYRARGAISLKQIVSAASERGYTNLLVFTEKNKRPQSLWFVKLPIGPTARFKLTSLILPKRIKNHGRPTGHRPELILNNFGTRLGHRLGRMLACLWPHDPQFRGRQVVTMHNQRDFIFFRHHRYVFEQNDKGGDVKARLQELGPRFTLKLKSLQLGTFDTTNGEYEWKHKPELDTSRRRFHI